MANDIIDSGAGSVGGAVGDDGGVRGAELQASSRRRKHRLRQPWHVQHARRPKTIRWDMIITSHPNIRLHLDRHPPTRDPVFVEIEMRGQAHRLLLQCDAGLLSGASNGFRPVQRRSIQIAATPSSTNPTQNLSASDPSSPSSFNPTPGL